MKVHLLVTISLALQLLGLILIQSVLKISKNKAYIFTLVATATKGLITLEYVKAIFRVQYRRRQPLNGGGYYYMASIGGNIVADMQNTPPSQNQG